MFKANGKIGSMMSAHLGGGAVIAPSRVPAFNTVAARTSPSVSFGPAATAG